MAVMQSFPALLFYYCRKYIDRKLIRKLSLSIIYSNFIEEFLYKLII